MLVMLPALAGHEISYYPSFYPQEIRIEPLDPGTAAREFANTASPLHAYIGAEPRFAGPLPAYLKTAESLGSFIVLSFNPKSPHMQDRTVRCGAVGFAVNALAKRADVVAHPYPITPFHADYVAHVDRVAPGSFASAESPPLVFQAGTAESLLVPQTPRQKTDWDVRIDEVPVSDVLRAAGIGFNLWPAAPWAKEGWFQAFHLLRPTLTDHADREQADRNYHLLTHGDFKDLAEQLSLERSLIAALTRSCERAVVGYRVHREYYSDDLSNGVENILADSQTGFNSALFVRTVKLKDFPWNGGLRIGMARSPVAGWNPVAGFTDPFGRLVWAAIADNAFLPISHESGWVPNRVELPAEQPRPRQSLRIPADAVMPQAGTGRLDAVGDKSATARVTYRLSASAFHDGTEMEVADLLYPFALAFRWGGAERGAAAFDPDIAVATQWMRERLRGVRIVRVEERMLAVADLTFKYRVLVVEIYLDNASSAGLENPLLAPPWSSVPWHVLALMEAAAERGIAAFSESEARRRGLPWLDLVRDPEQRLKLLALVKEFAASGYRPPALETLVTPEAAKVRWQALETFAQRSHHLLPTNGPYRLSDWSPEAAVLQVIRDFTYPVGLGTFDIYPYPPRALITGIERAGNRVLVTADYEIAVQQQRFHRLQRAPLVRASLRGTYPIRAFSRYVVLDAAGSVAAAGELAWERDGQRFALTLPQLPAGDYKLFAAIFLDGNTVRPSIGELGFRIE